MFCVFGISFLLIRILVNKRREFWKELTACENFQLTRDKLGLPVPLLTLNENMTSTCGPRTHFSQLIKN